MDKRRPLVTTTVQRDWTTSCWKRNRGGTSSVYHQDGLGSVVAVSSENTSQYSAQRYDAWGKRIPLSGVEPAFGYTGREPTQSGLIYYRSRYYDPELGRFIQRDKAGFMGGLNLYSYVGNNPVNFTDPIGFDACSASGSGGPITTPKATYGGSALCGGDREKVEAVLAEQMQGPCGVTMSCPAVEDAFGSTSNPVTAAIARADIYEANERALHKELTRVALRDANYIVDLFVAAAMAPLALGRAAIGGAPRAYSVAFEATVTERGVGTYAAHFAEANGQLLKATANPELAATLRRL